MQLATPSPSTNLQETVRSLLAQKGSAVWSISADASVLEALESMSEQHVGALAVLAAGDLIGIITERDYARKVILKGRQSSETRVREIMSSPVVSVSPQQTIAECMYLMTSRRIRYLPVLEAGRISGIISIGDVVNWVIKDQEQMIRHLQSYITGSYPN